MLRDEIKNLIARELDAKAQKRLKSVKSDIHIEHPGDPSHGDFSTNVAMQLAKPLKKNPRVFADLLVDKLISGSRDLFSMVEVDGPGFINFFLKPETLHKELSDTLKKKETYGQLSIGKDKRVNIEFISANPAGPIHIGNGRGAFLGDVLAKILRYTGFEVTSEYYINDAKVSEQIKELGKSARREGDKYPYVQKDLNKYPTLRKKVEVASSLAEAGYLVARELYQKQNEAVLKKLKIQFDIFFSENEMYEKGLDEKVLASLKRRRKLIEKEGAVWLKTTNHERVLIRSKEGKHPTYLLSDLIYHRDKVETRKFDKAIDIWGSDHHGYGAAFLEGLDEGLGIEPGKVELVITQFVSLIRKGKEVKMSKRKGEFDTLKRLVDEVGLDATRFFFLQRSPDSHMDFDLDLAKEKSEKNPVYYVQYAHARISSILRKATSQKSKAASHDLLKHPSELALIRELIKFPEIIEDTANDYQVQRLPHYAIKLADLFHRFYHDCRVLSDDKKMTGARLSLVLATKIVIKNTLGLMGISAPEKM